MIIQKPILVFKIHYVEIFTSTLGAPFPSFRKQDFELYKELINIINSLNPVTTSLIPFQISVESNDWIKYTKKAILN